MHGAIGPYQVEGTLGRGGMGIVLRARAPDGTLVAIKLLRADAGGLAAARFAREQRLQALLGAEAGFVPLLDAGESPAGPYLVLPLLTGGTLRTRIQRGPAALGATLELGRSLAAAMARAHAAGIVHRDLKPENVLFDERGRPLIADLGLAKHYDEGTPGASQSVALSRSGAAVGTMGYMPLEQMKDAKAASPSVDVFALGAILHECLAGEPAFAGASLVELYAKVEAGRPASLAARRPDVPRWLCSVIERALAPDPADRHADGAALLADLEAGPRRGRVPGRRALLVALGIAVTCGSGAWWLLERRARRDEALRLAREGWELVCRNARAAGVARLDQAIALAPTLAETYVLRARARAVIGGPGAGAAAAADLDRALELEPDHLSALTERTGLRIDRGDVPGGIADLRHLLKLEPQDADHWRTLGVLLRQQGDAAGALAALERSVALSPRDGMSLLALSDQYLLAGDARRALELAHRLVATEPDNVVALEHRATLLRAAGDRAGARRDLQRLLELLPEGHSQRERLLKEVEELGP